MRRTLADQSACAAASCSHFSCTHKHMPSLITATLNQHSKNSTLLTCAAFTAACLSSSAGICELFSCLHQLHLSATSCNS
jgi:hypothetical protein